MLIAPTRYAHELDFYLQLVNGYSVHAEILDSSNLASLLSDDEHAQITHPLMNRLHDYLTDSIKPKTVYYYTDFLYLRYIFFVLPDTEPSQLVLIGPYTTTTVTEDMRLTIMETYDLKPDNNVILEKFFKLVPCMQDSSFVQVSTGILSNYLWGKNAYKSTHISMSEKTFPVPVFYDEQMMEVHTVLDNRLVEQNYQKENQLLSIISQGQLSKLEQFLSVAGYRMPIEPRTPDPLRNLKNYLVIANSLLRKAAEQGGIHPIYIDDISRKFAYKIEAITSLEEGTTLHKSMLRKYCLLVHNHSMKGYSPLIQKVVIMIDSDLTADLTLSTLAEKLSVNASYLSALFHKETGTKLTPYVNNRRIEYAIMLLNTTSLQVQSIAQYSGFTDINYFTRIFKKEVGMTPSVYRRSITDQNK